MESRFWQEFAAIEERGGAVAAIEDGYFFRSIVDSALRYQQDLESGAVPIVGVNAYQNEDGQPEDIELFEVGDEAEQRQIRRLRQLRAERNQPAVDAALAELAAVTARGENVVPAVIDAVRAYATIGEICSVWSGQFGSWDAGVNAL
jgi:methylmalonyl-CoA mutase N-terminal domain/subunit